VRHVVGTRDWDELTAGGPPVPPGSALRYEAIRYEDDMPTALAAADVAVCRAGSSTTFELAAAALPAVMVPSPHVTGDHHTANARFMVEAGAAVMVPDAELDGARLASEVDSFLGDPERLAAMGRAAHAVARPNAAADIAALAEEHARA
jgi:UDP-N-acetylglucosamine--N-acetylmuramyl-(pentapeptide) pyrophosphoryl-undecaprenol N-acetylglucosamine transferase